MSDHEFKIGIRDAGRLVLYKLNADPDDWHTTRTLPPPIFMWLHVRGYARFRHDEGEMQISRHGKRYIRRLMRKKGMS